MFSEPGLLAEVISVEDIENVSRTRAASQKTLAGLWAFRRRDVRNDDEGRLLPGMQ